MAQLEQLWKEWKVEGSRKAKDRLLAEYAGLARQTAQRVAVGLPSHVEMGDLVGAGVMGLIRAVETFEPEREVKFETYAVHKIRGAILDELRSLDWVPRSVRQKGRSLQKAYSEMSGLLGRAPYDDEVAQHLGLTLVEFEELLTEVAPLTVLSLDEQDGMGDDAPALSETIADPQAANALAEIEEGQMKAMLRDAISGLPAKERLVVSMYHFEELNFKEIGRVMGVTESRVCQIHSKAIVKLRARVRLQAKK
ncbi:MAG TPA: FliA/WhiG family RNA polymerase sigma factor [Fibrobacteria bacterium]|nr:FliA/WhiG family RNA polymerase sigma factor [Fibrobacteria bacterium]